MDDDDDVERDPMIAFFHRNDGRPQPRRKPTSLFSPAPLPPVPAQPPPTFEDLLGKDAERLPEVTVPDAPVEKMTPRQKERLRALIREANTRRFESLNLYEPLPSQAAFHTSMARQRIARGGNRSGKTTTTIVELAWAVTGKHPQKGKYPLTDGIAMVVVKDEDKIGKVAWKKLGRAGAFRMVPDAATGLWRAWRPGDDESRSRPCPPLIPPRMIKDISWISRKDNIPKTVILHNGWEISFYSSKADPFSISGFAVDIVLFDEEIVHADWYPEAQARLVDRRGWFLWGATPQTGTQQLFDLHLRAEALAEERAEAASPPPDPPAVSEHFLSIWDNVHLDEKAKQDFVDSIDDEERRVRVDGEFAISGLRIYEAYFFPRGVSGVDPFPIPADWTRFLAIDPGHQVGAVLFAAVPPMKPEAAPGVDPALFGDFVYVYDEIYIRGCDASKMARAVKQHVGEQSFQSFLIDHHGGRLTEIGSGKTPEQQYRDAFKLEKVPTPASGVLFAYGSDDLDGGILRVRDALRVRPDGTSKLRVVRGACRNFVHEMERYQWKVVGGVATEKPQKRGDHLVDCVRYLVMHQALRYHKAKSVRVAPKSAYDAFQAFRSREKKRGKARHGGGITLG